MLSQYITDFITDQGGEVISVTPHPTKSEIHHKLTIKCRSCGNPYEQSYRDFRQQKKYQCVHCTKKENGARRAAKSTCVDFFEAHQCEVVGSFVNSHTPVSVRCRCGTQFERTLSDARTIVRAGRKLECVGCATSNKAKKQTLDYAEVRDFVANTGCELMSTEYNSQLDKLLIRCRLCSEPFTNTLKDFKNNGTYACAKCMSTSVSAGEEQLAAWLNSIGCNVVRNDRSVLDGLEIDILLPDHNIAIEYNGVHYHTEQFDRGKTYHQTKTNLCKAKGITLLHFWDVEWCTKADLCKSMILSRIHRSNRLYARSCKIGVVHDLQTKQQFLSENHIQGPDKSTIAYGLWHSGKLVSMMTFGKPRYQRAMQYEMHRFCTIKGYTIVGGASRMFAAFVRDHKPTTIISYADVRYSTGEVYHKLNFRLTHTSQPGYHYEKSGKLYNRLGFQKHKLIERYHNKYGDNINNMTEKQIATDDGYYRLWDCGQMTFVWTDTTVHQL